MQVSFTTTAFGDEAASLAAAQGSPTLPDPNHLFGIITLDHPGQAPVALPDDLPFLVLDLCADAPNALEAHNEAAASTIDWPNTLNLVATATTVHLVGDNGEDATYPRQDLVAALRQCAARFATFLEQLARSHPQFAFKAGQIRAALPI